MGHFINPSKLSASSKNFKSPSLKTTFSLQLASVKKSMFLSVEHCFVSHEANYDVSTRFLGFLNVCS